MYSQGKQISYLTTSIKKVSYGQQEESSYIVTSKATFGYVVFMLQFSFFSLKLSQTWDTITNNLQIINIISLNVAIVYKKESMCRHKQAIHEFIVFRHCITSSNPMQLWITLNWLIKLDKQIITTLFRTRIMGYSRQRSERK